MSTTQQLEYHGLYVILIGVMLSIVVTLAVAAVLEARSHRRRRGDRR